MRKKMGMFNFVLDSFKGEIFDFKVKRRVLVASTEYLFWNRCICCLNVPDSRELGYAIWYDPSKPPAVIKGVSMWNIHEKSKYLD